MSDELRSLLWTGSCLSVLDQLKLPFELDWIQCTSYCQVYSVIKNMNIRGAPAIGVAAAYGMALAAREAISMPDPEQFVRAAADYLKSARPTAINLAWAVDRCLAEGAPSLGTDAVATADELTAFADQLARDDEERNLALSKYGADLFDDGDTILTICNTGALATYRYGTAFGAINEAFKQGKNIQVIALETRPYLQGARLTALELVTAGIPFHLITDGMAGFTMSHGMATKVIVGADRIAANGDFANKIGTYQLAVLARYHGLPFYTAAPMSSFDFTIASGAEIPIEQRDEDEVLTFAGQRVAANGSHAYNPSFDVTPNELLTGIVTDRGVFRPPFGKWEQP
ncbi:S-methyl-5-thioribose-1-phosphate isomerase [bacterium]|nr:S-methyl-5-thioribose-1-phosphate isomerase [bacterium]